ncbi:ADAMTS-like protein 2 isoform X2 [Cynoglossus semilaevis]|uniref:Si:ch211-267e7.3 n=1 Tax=Cynoglossus semilaevis TaxID=244447 RepID=A0A3P8X045_CYNSE|nr:ADAMTS-like protein 2 isoform X2 [Cynoglossus semilaevis]
MFGNGGSALPVCFFLPLLLLLLPLLPLNKAWPSKEEVFQWWGEWSSWSSCSRSCGGGVRSQERHCLIQRLSTTQNNISFCVGSSKQYQLCPDQPCPSPHVSFKQHQCSQFNSKAFGRRYYQWVPLYPADYISISNKPCDLQCTTINGERQLLVPAHDGTFCHDTKYHGVCIEGICQPVGCDGELFSSRRVDRCGVCGGNGASCQRVSGSYKKALTQLGYVFITNIPAEATDIQIIERHKTENILALSDEAGHFFFNGNTVFDNPQNFHVAGTVFKYRRPSNVLSDGLEYIIAQGPTLHGLNVMYYNLNGKLPHITYEYTVPLQSYDVTAEEVLSINPDRPSLNFTHNELREEDTRGGEVRLSNHSAGSVTSLYKYSTEMLTEEQSHDQLQQEKFEDKGDKEDVWKIITPTPTPLVAMLVHRAADVAGRVFSHSDVEEEQGPPAPSGYRSSSNSIEPPAAGDNTVHLPFPGSQSVLPEEEPYLLLEELQYNQTHSLTQSNTYSVHHTLVEPHSPETPADTPTHAAAVVKVQQVSAVEAANTESNDFDVGLDQDVSLADMYRWKVSAYAPCSSTCTTGITTSYALCVRYDGSEVDDSYCDSLTRPEPTHEFCTGKECPPRWETSGWSDCSRTCGEGVQYRTVRCWKMLSPGLDSSVYDSLCLSHDLHKPANRKVCHGQSCGPQWEVSEWSECSARCGSRGVRTREVRCSIEMRLCNQTSKPAESQECEGPPCDRRWTVSDWGPCSGVCGEGRMVRAVTCRSSGGVVMSEEQCDQSLRPLAVYPCGDKNCAPHWVGQEWQQCNASCGRGTRQRQVVCAGLEDGVFKEFPESSCDQNNKPEISSPCFQRPCSKWFTTSWSQCSKSCGSGVQVREVKCYQGEELVTRGHSCDSALKPEARQSCEIQSCPTEATAVAAPAASVAVDDACQDKPTANCALVLKVKLCSHWYYRKACCQSCKAP